MVFAHPIQPRPEFLVRLLQHPLVALERADLGRLYVSLSLETLNLPVKPVDFSSEHAIAPHALRVGALKSVGHGTGVLALARSWRARTLVGVVHGVVVLSVSLGGEGEHELEELGPSWNNWSD
jgi:hypothetical protein